MTTLEAQFESLAPWITSFAIQGRTLGGAYNAEADGRMAHFFHRFPCPGRVLELGCLEGGHTIPLARKADEVVAIDCRQENIEKARFIQRISGVGNIRFLVADLESFDVASLGRFHVVFNVGVLYHLVEPWRLLHSLAKITASMFLWTHIAPSRWLCVRRGGYRGRMYPEGGVEDPLSGLHPKSFWPTQSELVRMLSDAGFVDTEIIEFEKHHPHGPAILLACRSRAAATARPSQIGVIPR